METHPLNPKPKKISLLNKVILLLFGLFLTTLIFAFSIQLLQELGIWIGILLNTILVFIGFYYVQKGTQLRLITWGILVTLVTGTTFFIIGMQILKNLIINVTA